MNESHEHSDSDGTKPGSATDPGKRSGVRLLLIFGLVGGICGLICCGGGYWIGTMAFRQIGVQVAAQIRDQPLLQTHVGKLLDCQIDLAATAELEQQDVIVFQLRGSKSDAILTTEVETRDGVEQVLWAALEMPDGKTYELDFK